MIGLGHNQPPLGVEIIDLDWCYHLSPDERPFNLLRTDKLGLGPWYRLPKDRGTTSYTFHGPPGTQVALYYSSDGKMAYELDRWTYPQAGSHYEPWALIRAEYAAYFVGRSEVLLGVGGQPIAGCRPSGPIPEVTVTCDWGL